MALKNTAAVRWTAAAFLYVSRLKILWVNFYERDSYCDFLASRPVGHLSE